MSESERDPEVLALFIEESEEALQRMEELLLAAERGEQQDDIFHLLFRDIHTIKGTSGFLALTKTASLSHAAEDLMALFRDDPSIATPEHFSLQMKVVDLLRELVDWVGQTGDEGPADTQPLTTSLREALAAVTARSESDSVAAPESQVAEEQVAEAPAATAESEAGPDAQPEAPAEASESAQAATLSDNDNGVSAAAPSTENRPSETGKAEDPTEMTAEQTLDEGTAPGKANSNDKAVESKAARQEAARMESADSTVRVNVGVLDRLMNLMGELVLSRNQVVQLLKTKVEGNGNGNANAQAIFQRLTLVTSEMQEEIMKTRMQPVARVFERIPRMVRDLCQVTGKKVSCQIDGTATEIDKALVEAIRDPIMHIVRNAIDHGMESPDDRSSVGKPSSGTLAVRASHEGGMVLIEIQDDGRGMNPKRLREKAIEKGLITSSEAQRLSDREALDLVFRPGFSTAAKVSDISGRGVGMDVVRSSVERAGGQVELDSTLGRGTTIRLKMPLTLAIIPALLVKVQGQRFAIPQINLTELVYLDEEQAGSAIETVRGTPIYRLRGEVLPLVSLRKTLEQPERAPSQGVYIVVVSVGSARYGLLVDEIHDTEEIVIKPLHGRLKRLSCYAGATVLGDGGLALILEVAGIAGMSGLDFGGRESVTDEAPVSAKQTQTMLVFTAGSGAQCAVPLAMVARLEQVEPVMIEQVSDREVLQYRGSIMPIIRPESVLPLGQADARDKQQLVVFDFGNPVGMAVDRIIDIVDVETSADHSTTNASPYSIGQTVIFDKTTILLDVYDTVRQLVPNFTKEPSLQPKRRPRIILADDSVAMRTAIGEYLRAQGVEVLEADTGEGVLTKLRAEEVNAIDAVVTDYEMPGLNGLDVVRAVRKESEMPVIVWTQHEDPAFHERVKGAGGTACVDKLQRESLVAALHECGLFSAAMNSNHSEAA